MLLFFWEIRCSLQRKFLRIKVPRSSTKKNKYKTKKQQQKRNKDKKKGTQMPFYFWFVNDTSLCKIIVKREAMTC